MLKPYVSIITVCLNNIKTLDTCLQSVKKQTYPNIEHIIIDGVSTDGSLEAIAAYNPAKYTSEPDSGIYDAMNKGLALASGKYAIYLNADDLLASDQVIEQLVEAAIGFDLVCAEVDIFKENKLYRRYLSQYFRPWMFTFGHQPPHPGFFCKTEILKSAQGFNDTYRIAGDFDLMLRIFSLPQLKWKPIPLTAVKMQHGGASSGSLNKKQTMNLEIKKSLKEQGRIASSILIWSKYLIKVFQVKIF